MRPWLVLFEDEGWRSLRPLTEVLPTPALAFGGSNLAARWLARTQCHLFACEARAEAIAAWQGAPAAGRERPKPGDPVVAVNAAALPGEWVAAAALSGEPGAWHLGGRMLAARAPFERIAPGIGTGERFVKFLRDLRLPDQSLPAGQARLLEWPWQLVEWNEAALLEDLASLDFENHGGIHRLAAVLEPARIRLDRGARVDPHAVLDAREGPIRLGEGVIVHPQTVVVGPCVVGAGTQLHGGLVARSTIGPGCRIAGEVDVTIWQGWANKRHHGFVGHSVIGEWCNLGALTTTSDLKNNYGPVRVWTEGGAVDSGNPKVGSLLGAHVKTGIGSLLPTGASIGTGSNLFGGGRFAPKRLPPFSWWDGERAIEHRLEDFLRTARIVCSRRDRVLEPGEEAALRALHAASAAERAAERGASPLPA